MILFNIRQKVFFTLHIYLFETFASSKSNETRNLLKKNAIENSLLTNRFLREETVYKYV